MDIEIDVSEWQPSEAESVYKVLALINFFIDAGYKGKLLKLAEMASAWSEEWRGKIAEKSEDEQIFGKLMLNVAKNKLLFIKSLDELLTEVNKSIILLTNKNTSSKVINPFRGSEKITRRMK